MKKGLVISTLGLGLILGGCSEDTTKVVEDNPIVEENNIEDNQVVEENNTEAVEQEEQSVQGEFEGYENDTVITVYGQEYDISRIDVPEEVKENDEVEVTYIEEDGVNYATSVQVLQASSDSIAYEATGTFVGWSDVHTVAITVDGNEMTFQTAEYEHEDALQNVAENDTISFEYYTKDGMNFITDVTIGEESASAELDAAGTLIGWADVHTVLIEEDGQETSYQTDKVDVEQVNSINDGEEVTFTYEEDGGVRYLLSIELK